MSNKVENPKILEKVNALKEKIDLMDIASLKRRKDKIIEFGVMDFRSDSDKKEVLKLLDEALELNLSPEEFRNRVYKLIILHNKFRKYTKKLSIGTSFDTKELKQTVSSSQSNNQANQTAEIDNSQLNIFTILKDTLVYSFRKDKLIEVEKIFSTLDNDKKSQVLVIMSKIKREVINNTSPNWDIIDDCFSEIEAIVGGSGEDGGGTEEKSEGVASNGEKKWLDRKIEALRLWIFDSADLNAIQAIDIDGKVETIKEFNDKLTKLIEVIKKSKGFKKLPIDQQTKIIKGLQKIGTGLEKQQNKTLDFLDKKINGLAKQVEDSKTELLTIIIEGENVQFTSKKEAFEFVKNLKIEAEGKFQSFLTNSVEMFGSSLQSILLNDAVILPYNVSKFFIKKTGESYQDNNNPLWTGLIGFLAITSSFFALNYTETFFRRIVLDRLALNTPLKKIGIKKFNLNKQLIIEEDIVKSNDVDLNDKDKGLKSKYNNRLEILSYFENNIGDIPEEDRLAYKQSLKSLRKYLPVNTNTFGLKAQALYEEYGLIGRYWQANKYGIIGDIDAYIQKKAQEGMFEKKDDFNKSSQFLYNENIFFDENNKISPLKGETESENLKYIRAYIETIPDEQKRADTLKSLNEYLTKFKSRPDTEDIMKAKIALILDKNIASTDTLISQIDKDFFNERGWNLYNNKTRKKSIFSEQGRQKKAEGLRKIKGKLTPSFIAKGNTFMMKLRQAIKDGDIVLTMEQYKEIRKQLFEGKRPRVAGIEAINFYKQYGLNLHIGLNNLSNLENINIDDIITAGKEASLEVKKAKEIFESDFYKNGNHIIDLDNDNFPDEVKNGKMSETDVEKMRDEFKVYVEGLKYIDRYSVNLELIKIYSGYLDKNYIKTKLEGQGVEFNNKSNVKKFLSRVNRGEIFLEDKNIEAVIDDLKNGKSFDDLLTQGLIKTELEIEVKNNTGTIEKVIISQKSIGTLNDEELDDNLNKVFNDINDTGKKLGKQHFRLDAFGIFRGAELNTDGLYEGKLKIDDYKDTELLLRNTLLEFDNNRQIDSTELQKLFGNINKGNDYISEEFFLKLRNALGILETDLLVDSNTTLDNFHEYIRSELKIKLETLFNGYEGKNLTEQRDILDRFNKIFDIGDSEVNSKKITALKEISFQGFGHYLDKRIKYGEGLADNKAKQIKEENREYEEKQKKLDKVDSYIFEKNKEITNLEGYLKNDIPSDLEGSRDYYNELKNTYGVDMGNIREPTDIEGIDYHERAQKLQELAYERINQLQEEKFNLLLEKKNIDIAGLSSDEKKFLTSFVEDNIIERLKTHLVINNSFNTESRKKLRQFRLGVIDLESDLFKEISDVNGIYSKIQTDFEIQHLHSIGELLKMKLDLNDRLKFHIDFHNGKIKAKNFLKRLFNKIG